MLLLASMALWPGRKDKAESPGVADRNDYLSTLSLLLRQRWPKNRTINIVCHGHSVPAGYTKSPVVDSLNAYPHLLHARLQQRYPYAVINVIVTAIGGEDSDDGCKRFDRDVLSLNPDLITIDYALNDRRIRLGKARWAWESMIQQARARDVPVILLTPTVDLDAKLDDPDDPLNQHAEQIRCLACEYHVGLADSLHAFKDYAGRGGRLEELMSQKNHPNRNGHELVTQKLLEWFPERLSANQSTGGGVLKSPRRP